jgi:DNA repair protein RecO
MLQLEFLSAAVPLLKRSANKDNQMAVLFTEKYGKVSVLLQSGRKISSKLSPHVEPGGVAEVLYVQGKKIKRLIGAKKIKRHENIWNNYHKLAACLYFFEVFNQLVKSDYPDTQLYHLLRYFLETLDGPAIKDELDSQFFTALMIYRLLYLLGYQSFSGICQYCQNELSGEAFFVFERGEIQCAECARGVGARGKIHLPKNLLDICNQLSTQSDLKIRLSVVDRENFINFSRFLLGYNLDYPVVGQKLFI